MTSWCGIGEDWWLPSCEPTCQGDRLSPLARIGCRWFAVLMSAPRCSMGGRCSCAGFTFPRRPASTADTPSSPKPASSSEESTGVRLCARKRSDWSASAVDSGRAWGTGCQSGQSLWIGVVTCQPGCEGQRNCEAKSIAADATRRACDVLIGLGSRTYLRLIRVEQHQVLVARTF